LKGAGVAVGLPFLDAMQPAFAGSKRAELPRLGIVYSPNGMHMPAWSPRGDPAWNAPGGTLQPLAAFRHCVTVLTGLRMEPALEEAAASAPHSLACAGFLTGCAPLRSEGPFRAARSLDQEAAEASVKDTWLSSIELACEEPVGWQEREIGYSPAYLNHLSWRTPFMPMPAQTSPREAFERLFRGAGSETFLSGRLLDTVNASAKTLSKSLGAADRSHLSDYLARLRQIERAVTNPLEPSKAETARLMMDIVAVAFQTGTTRVATVMLGREKSRSTFPELNIAETHHQLSHRYRDEATIQKLCAIDRHHTALFAYLLEQLQSMDTPEGTVLDSCILLFGSGLSEGNQHRHENLPIAAAGAWMNEERAQGLSCGGKTLADLRAAMAGAFRGDRRGLKS
jgi:hypothetical protein